MSILVLNWCCATAAEACTVDLSDRRLLHLKRLQRERFGKAQMLRHALGRQGHVPAENRLGQLGMLGAQIAVVSRHSNVDAPVTLSLHEKLLANPEQPRTVTCRHQRLMEARVRQRPVVAYF